MKFGEMGKCSKIGAYKGIAVMLAVGSLALIVARLLV